MSLLRSLLSSGAGRRPRRPWPRPLLLLGAACLLGCAATEVRVQAPAEDGRPPAEKLRVSAPAADPGRPAPPVVDQPESGAVPIAGSELVHGRATVMVRAPVARVREAVLAFPRYPEFMPHYRSARELGPGREAVRQVYMEVTALHGALRMWAQVEVLPVEVAGGVEIHRTAFVRGNVRDFQAVWRLRPIDENRTELTLEVFLHPRLPLPTSVLNAENVEGATKGVLAVKRRVEQSSG